MDDETSTVDVSISGQKVRVPCRLVAGADIITKGVLPRVAYVYQEEWRVEPISTAPKVIAALARDPRATDYFTFTQGFTDTRPRYPYRYDWDNIAAIPIRSFDDWWTRRVSPDLRKDVRRSEKRGLSVRVTEFTDDLVRGIKEIYDELPVRQGRPFWHYKKDFSKVKEENSSFIDRSVFIGAFFGNQLVGFIKIVRCAGVGRMMQIITKESHFEKRPGNALIHAAVRWAADNSLSYLTYGKYTYDSKKNSSIVQFKRRNGFEEIHYPRYFVPLTPRGRLLISLGVHRGFRRFVPEVIIGPLKAARLFLRHCRQASPPHLTGADEQPQ